MASECREEAVQGKKEAIHTKKRDQEVEMTDKIVLWNGNLLTMDSGNRRAEALAISKGRIVGVGSNEEIRRLYGEEWKFIDRHGRTVLPGFMDSHVHFIATPITAV